MWLTASAPPSALGLPSRGGGEEEEEEEEGRETGGTLQPRWYLKNEKALKTCLVT